MKDPLPLPPQYVVDVLTPYAESLGLRTLPLHVHEILAAFCFYHIIYSFVSPILSRSICPSIYSRLSYKTARNWDIHLVSLVQSLLISSLSLWVLSNGNEVPNTDWRSRIWGYTGAGGMVQALAAGYFAWDLSISLSQFSILGWSSLIHAAGALFVTTIGFRPFANHYGLAFILYELSTPFLNIHWFLDKFQMTGSRVQLYNGITLVLTFFLCRIVWGTYQSVLIYYDMYEAFRWQKSQEKHFETPASLASSYSEEQHLSHLPLPLVLLYPVGNTTLTMLNFYWFHTMIKTIRRRFDTKVRKE